MAIPRNLANLANQLNTDGEVPKIEVGDTSVAVTDTGSNGKITGTADNTAVFSVEKDKTFVLQGGSSSTGIGIAFPATQSASTNANTLDDYEEGTWSPTVGGNSTYTIQAGKYTKIGNQVTAWFDMYINAIGTGSTTTLSGLPFTSANDGVQGRGVSIGYFTDLGVNVVCLTMRLDANSSSFNNATLAAAGASVSNASAIFQSATRITGTITYNIS